MQSWTARVCGGLGLVLLSLVCVSRGETTATAQPPSVAPLRTDGQLASEARGLCARARGSRKPVLVTLGADWCRDCREMQHLSTMDPLATALRRYEQLDINVGAFDRHSELRSAWGVRVIAQWVVVTPESCEQPLHEWPRAAQRTLEPSTGAPVNPRELASWLARNERPRP